MLSVLRQTAPTVATLICMALLAMWLTGAHGHRHIGGHPEEHVVNGPKAAHSGLDHAHDAAHHEPLPDTGPFAPHPPSLVHGDGHENIELQGLQPPPGKLLADIPALVLLFCAFFVLAGPRLLRVSAIADPPRTRSEARSLRPPLRGPPRSSVALT